MFYKFTGFILFKKIFVDLSARGMMLPILQNI